MPFYLTKLRKAIALNKKAIIAAKALTTKLGLNITYIMFEFWLSCRKLFCKLAYGLQNSAVKVKRGLGLKKEKNEFKLLANRGKAEGNTPVDLVISNIQRTYNHKGEFESVLILYKPL